MARRNAVLHDADSQSTRGLVKACQQPSNIITCMEMSSISQLTCDAFIRGRIEDGFTYDAIAAELQHFYPGLVGLSSRSVRRYCSLNDISYSSRLSAEQLDQLVGRVVLQVV